MPGGAGPANQAKDLGSFRETRGKAKQFTTANGRTVIVKDAFVYSNKGAHVPRSARSDLELIEHRIQVLEPSAAPD